MVRGLEVFKTHFQSFKDKYALIGGTACFLVMENAGMDFRSTKDLDIVLFIEAIDQEFVNSFMEFITHGGYQNRQKSTGKKEFYRFSLPSNIHYPAMIELFTRKQGNVKIDLQKHHLTPILLNESEISLSAILLDESYYDFIHAGKIEVDGLSTITAAHLIPLKAKAYLDLKSRKLAGDESVKENDIKKHKNDIIRLYRLLAEDSHVILPPSVKNDMIEFIIRLENDPIDMKSLNMKGAKYQDVLQLLKTVYKLSNQSSLNELSAGEGLAEGVEIMKVK